MITCNIPNCNDLFDSVLELMIHKHECHDSLTDSQKIILKKWVDV